MDHEARMAIARRVTDYILRRHPDVAAVGVHGSTAKGEDRENSDLEMVAITRGPPDTAHYQVIHDGIVIEVEFLALEEAERETSQVRWDWPMSVDGWVHVSPTHDPEGVLPRISGIAANPDPKKLELRVRGSFVSMYEDLCKIRNFRISGEETLARLMCHGFALYGVARFLAFVNHQYFNGIRNLVTKPRDFTVLPTHFWEDYPQLLGVEGPTLELADRAERLFRECRELLVAHGSTFPDDLSLEEKLERGREIRGA